MIKLHVKIGNDWKMVFCNNLNRVMTTEDKSKALPQKAIWARDDLNYFSNKFGNDEFKLINV